MKTDSRRNQFLIVAAICACFQGIASAELFTISTHADSMIAEYSVSGPSTTNSSYSTFGGMVPSGSIIQDFLMPDGTGTFAITHSVANGGGTIAAGSTGQSWILRVNPGQTSATNTYNTTTWLQFDLSQFSPGDVVSAASLNMTAARLSSGNPAAPGTSATNKRLNVFGLRQSQMLIEGQPWTEANLSYSTAPSMFQDTDAPNVEKSGFGYDYLDLVPNGDTDTTNLIATEIVGTSGTGSTGGVLIPGLVAEQLMTHSTDALKGFIQAAIDGGDDYVTFIYTRRESSASDQFYISREGAAAAGNSSFAPFLTVELSVPQPTGDFDGDGDVDGADFVAWQTNFPVLSGAVAGQGDADNDGDVDGADFDAWQMGFPSVGGGGASPVPEPSCIGLLVIGIGTVRLAWPRRRRGQSLGSL